MATPASQLKPVAVDINLRPLEVARGLRQQPGFVFLDSASLDPLSKAPPGGGISILASNPEKIIQGNWQRKNQTCDPGLDLLRQELLAEKSPAHSFNCEFPTGGAIGWFEYDGDYCFGLYHHMLVFDHHRSQWFEIGDQQSRIDASQTSASTPPEKGPVFEAKFSPSMDRRDFCRRVVRAQEYIASGDIYQVNLSHEFVSPCPSTGQEKGQPGFSLYERLREVSPAPYAAYLDLAGRQVLSSSPELFLRISEGKVTTRPIKGTRPRFRDRAMDENSARELIASKKEIAELIMITDLERSDLGKICKTGSIEVSELLKLEQFEHVYHLVSNVQGKLRSDTDSLDALLSCFPGGSITGAPKIRSMQIIDELETIPRGLYTGAIGIFGFNDMSIFNIAIRTATIEDQQLRFNVGAGIVADSVPEQEFEETLHKARGILEACKVKTE